MDIQLTDFENTCLIVTLGLITNVINHFNVDFIIPITMADENMKRAHFRNAIIEQKFWFKTNCIKNDLDSYHQSDLESSNYIRSQPEDDETQAFEELFIFEILEGKPESNFPGMFTLIRKFMEVQNYSQEHQDQIE